MGYDNTKREQKSQESRERIIEAAKSLILARGYDAVSVSDITKEAGVSKGAFYIHFKTKEDLIEEMIDIVFLDIKQASNEKDVEG
ncbi:MAG: helix-turn-helix transcriptional regulator, partial [Clostridia bacterium]|nr:helix-turn-helix transcriptional regulator [Clostridia bacterium]